jgi:hypothetical protein
VIPGGAVRVDLIGIKATVQVRAGASDEEVALGPEPIPYECAVGDETACDPANDLPGVPGRRGNSDCVPTGPTNPCGRFVTIPTSDDCGPGGVCASLDGGAGTKLDQCRTNGFCVMGGVQIPLAPSVGNYTAAPSGSVLFGWDSSNTGATLEANGTWDLPPAVFEDPIGPNGIRVNIGGLSVALECTMGVDSGGPYGVGVPGESSPTPNALLISFPIQSP